MSVLTVEVGAVRAPTKSANTAAGFAMAPSNQSRPPEVEIRPSSRNTLHHETQTFGRKQASGVGTMTYVCAHFQSGPAAWRRGAHRQRPFSTETAAWLRRLGSGLVLCSTEPDLQRQHVSHRVG